MVSINRTYRNDDDDDDFVFPRISILRHAQRSVRPQLPPTTFVKAWELLRPALTIRAGTDIMIPNRVDTHVRQPGNAQRVQVHPFAIANVTYS